MTPEEMPHDGRPGISQGRFPARLALFGFVLREDFCRESDVDVLVEFKPEHVPGLAVVAMEIELSAILGRKVDLSTPESLNAHLRDRILAEAEALYVES